MSHKLLTLLTRRGSSHGKTPDQAATAPKRWYDETSPLWQDAGSTPASANNDVVGQWDDISGFGGILSQTTTGQKPLLKTASQNGLRGIKFDGSDDLLNGSTAVSNYITAAAYTWFFVMNMQAVVANSGTPYLNDGIVEDGGAFLGLFGRNNTSPELNLYNWDGNADAAVIALTLNAPHVVMCRHQGGNLYLSVDGGAEVSAPSGNTSNLGNMIRIGYSAGNKAFNGILYQLNFWDVALGTQDITDLIAGYKYKWGVA